MSQTNDAPRNDRNKRLIARFRDGAPRYVRVSVGVAFIVGGIFSFLPVLGPWMFPVGLAILAPDMPFARRLLRRAIRLSLKYKLIRIRRPNVKTTGSPREDS
jgi:hypothetical protein